MKLLYSKVPNEITTDSSNLSSALYFIPIEEIAASSSTIFLIPKDTKTQFSSVYFTFHPSSNLTLANADSLSLESSTCSPSHNIISTGCLVLILVATSKRSSLYDIAKDLSIISNIASLLSTFFSKLI
eukprot:NODE_40_length_35084_cov_0.543519.p23 type:complete len:128 gc:universal NODE_40_length_35084_cov_0.543519:1164-1547(+)